MFTERKVKLLKVEENKQKNDIIQVILGEMYNLQKWPKGSGWHFWQVDFLEVDHLSKYPKSKQAWVANPSPYKLCT